MTEPDDDATQLTTGASEPARMTRELVWGALTVAFAFFIATASLRTYRGREGRGSSQVWDVWQRLAGDLPGGDSVAVRVGYVLILIAFTGGCLVALWLALAADGSDEASGQSSFDTP
jgi:hypothetical protein